MKKNIVWYVKDPCKSGVKIVTVQLDFVAFFVARVKLENE